VAYIRDQIDPGTRTARARLDVANNGEHLRPGMFATVTVVDPHGTEGEEAPRVLVVPSGALQRDGDRQVAFVPLGGNRYERRVLTLGRRTGAYAEILDGLAAGESVVVEGTFILKSEAARHRMGGGHGH
jgi:multidrug efflux pump subunit AcrA (membrane-fusion protein)